MVARQQAATPGEAVRAELPVHFTMHSLRHTFCSLLISAGVSPVYVQQQAGHSDVSFTVSVYGSWFPATAPGAMDRLAEGAPGLDLGKAVARAVAKPDFRPAPEKSVL